MSKYLEHHPRAVEQEPERKPPARPTPSRAQLADAEAAGVTGLVLGRQVTALVEPQGEDVVVVVQDGKSRATDLGREGPGEAGQDLTSWLSQARSKTVTPPGWSGATSAVRW
jgi:hypothetical protein